MNRCTECHINFSKTSNLTAHVKRKHPDMLHILAPKKVKQSQSSVHCLECNKNFASLGNLRLHVKRQHPDKLEEIAPVKKKNYICPYCSENFQTLKQFIFHKKTHKVRANLKCPLCPYIGCGRENLISHYRTDHFLTIENECLKFHSFEDFQSWKWKIEEESYSSFVKMYGSKKATNCTTMNYNCHRSGVYKKKGMNTRQLKTQGTNKIGGYCPARMNIKIMEDKKCVVNFCKNHIGHKQEQDLGHLFLSKLQKQNVAAKIAANIPFKVILDEVRDSEPNSHLERLHLLTKKDLYNLEQCFNLGGSSGSIIGDDDNLLIESDDEKMALINTVSKTSLETEKSLEEAKKKLILHLTEQVNDLASFEELEAVRKIVVPIKQTIDALRYQKDNMNLAFPSTSRTPSNKKILPQRKFFPTKNIKRKRSKLPKPSQEDANLIAAKALIKL